MVTRAEFGIAPIREQFSEETELPAEAYPEQYSISRDSDRCSTLYVVTWPSYDD